MLKWTSPGMSAKAPSMADVHAPQVIPSMAIVVVAVLALKDCPWPIVAVATAVFP